MTRPTSGFTEHGMKKLRATALAAAFGLSGIACGAAQKPKVVHVNQNLDPCMKLEDIETEDKKEGKKTHALTTEFDNVCDESRAIERWAAMRRADGKPDMASIAVALAVDVERHPSLKQALKRGLSRNAMTLEEAQEKVREYDIKMQEQALERARAAQEAKGACRMREEQDDTIVWECSVNIDDTPKAKPPAEEKKTAPAVVPAVAPAEKEKTEPDTKPRPSKTPRAPTPAGKAMPV